MKSIFQVLYYCFSTVEVFPILGTDLKHSFNFLHDAQGKLQEIVRKKFDAAVSAGNNNAVERYLDNSCTKLKPGIYKLRIESQTTEVE